ncbi:MAG TPA: DUF4175 family protein [Thermodesulfobacteriota bacterium]|nr:DUF4175 family protein [Thermodesulfobacteriota bacterium]
MYISPEEILEQVFVDLRRKRKRILIENGGVEFLLVSLVILGAVSILSYVYPNPIYFSALKLIAITGLCFGFCRFLLPALLKNERKSGIALELEKLLPGLGEEVLSAVLLSSDLKKNDIELGISSSLVKAHLDKVAHKLGSLDLSPVIPERKSIKYKNPLLAVSILLLAVLVFAPRDFRTFLFSTQILPSSEPALLDLADITIQYQYPDYTKIPAKEVRGSNGDVRALKGTHVTFLAEAINQFHKGRLFLEQGNVIPVNLEDGRIKAEFTVVSSGSFFIEDEDGKFRSKSFKITSEEDNLPQITVNTPAGEIMETGEKDKLELYYTAQDDFGLTKLVLSWQGKNGESSKLIRQEKEEPQTAEGKFVWDLSLVESEPDEIIQAKIKAYDNDTVSGPKVGVSNTIRVQIKNSRKKHQDILAQAEEVMDKLLHVLADEIESSRLKAALSENAANRGETEPRTELDRIKKDQEGIAGKIEDALSSLNNLLGKMQDDQFSDYTFYLGLSNMRIRIEELLQERRNLLSSLSAGDLLRLDGLITREINEFEDDIIFLDSMLKGERLEESLVYGKETLDKYNQLSALLEKLRQTGDEAMMGEIEGKIEELRSLVSQLAEKLSSISADIYEGFLNPDAFESLDLQDRLDEISRLAQEGKIEEALELLSGIKDSLESMIASLESGFQSFSTASLSKELAKLNELIARIEGIEKEQTALKQRTETLKESLLKSPPKNESLLEFAERERKKVEQLKSRLMQARDKPYAGEPESEVIKGFNPIDQALRKTDELERWLLALELEEALKNAQELEAETSGLNNLIKLFGKTAESHGEIERAEEMAKGIREDIEQFLKGGAKDVQSYQVAERQDKIQAETRDLEDTLVQYQDDLPLSPGIGENLSESKGFMGGASKSLKSKEVSKAISNQEEAIKSLKKAKEEAGQLLKKYQLSARGMGPPVPFVLGGNQPREGPRGIDTGYVEIPAPGESERGKEFKENLMKALKGGSPDGYSELNKKYYERIIK